MNFVVKWVNWVESSLNERTETKVDQWVHGAHE